MISPGEPGKSDERQLSFESDDYAYWLSAVFSLLKIRQGFSGRKFFRWLDRSEVFHSLSGCVEKAVLLAPAGIGSQNPEFAVRAMQLLPKGDTGVTELFTEINGGTAIPKDQLEYQKLITSVFNARQEIIPLFA